MSMSELGPDSSAGIDFTGTKVITKQSFKDECDLNVLLKHYNTNALLRASKDLSFGEVIDLESIPDYEGYNNTVLKVQEEFMKLDVNVRDRFKNDPVEMMKFLSDAKNVDEAVKLGLVVKKEPVEPTPSGASATVGGAAK